MENSVSKGSMSVSEAGRKGGNTCKAKHGKEFFSQIGRVGGTETSKRHGPEFVAERGRKGGRRVKELISKGKEMEAKSLEAAENQD